MQLLEDEAWNHAIKIAESSRTRNKAVILCEGEVQNETSRRSPSSYSFKEKAPDSKFYKDCLPSLYKRKHCPVFVNCGGRSDVIKTFQALYEILSDPESSDSYYLELDNLFAIVDLDLSPGAIEGYLHRDTEEIFKSLYSDSFIMEGPTSDHKVFTTGLIHREAYFVLPQLQEVYDDFELKESVRFQQLPIDLTQVYYAALSHISENKGLEENYEFIRNRLSRFRKELPENYLDLKSFCNEEFLIAGNRFIPTEMLLFSNIKECFWKQLEFPEENESRCIEDQLEMEIATFFSKSSQDGKSLFHICQILECICRNYHP